MRPGGCRGAPDGEGTVSVLGLRHPRSVGSRASSPALSQIVSFPVMLVLLRPKVSPSPRLASLLFLAQKSTDLHHRFLMSWAESEDQPEARDAARGSARSRVAGPGSLLLGTAIVRDFREPFSTQCEGGRQIFVKRAMALFLERDFSTCQRSGNAIRAYGIDLAAVVVKVSRKRERELFYRSRRQTTDIQAYFVDSATQSWG